MTVVSSHIIALVLSLQTLCTCIIFTLGQYIYQFYLQLYPSLFREIGNITQINVRTSSKINQCAKNLSVDSAAQSWAQQRSAEVFLWINIWSFVPIIVMTYALGLYTQRLGRRFILFLPMFGTAIQLSIWLAIIYFSLPDYWWYIAAFLVGLSGSDNVRNFVLNLFIAENTEESDRSSRFVLFGAMTTIVSAIGSFIIGYCIAWYGFTLLFWFAFLLQIVSIFLVRFFFKSDPTQYARVHLTEEDNDSISLTTPKRYCQEWFDLWNIFKYQQTKRKKFFCVLLILSAYALFSFICTSFIVLLLYLLNAPFCWTSEQIGNYSATALIAFGVLSVLGMKCLTYFNADDTIICILGHIFFIVASIWMGTAQTDWQMYASLVFSSFSGYQNYLTLSMISKWLDSYERTHVFTLVTVLNTIMKIGGYVFFNWIYARTVMTQKNFAFLLAAGLNIIPLTMNICLWCISRWMPDDQFERTDEIDLQTESMMKNTSQWPLRMSDANTILIPQQLADPARSNSISSME